MAITRSGPVTRDTSTVALGLAKILIGPYQANVTQNQPVLDQTLNSLGALSNTDFTSNVDYWRLESGFPLMEDMTIPLRETAQLECGMKEIKPWNLAIARGLDPSGVSDAHAVSVTKTTAAGTIDDAMEISVPNATGVDEEWVVVFDASSGYVVYGRESGIVQDATDADGSISSSFTAVDSSDNDLFTIPANYFTGTWSENDTFVFRTYSQGGYNDNHDGTINLGSIKAPDYVRMEAIYTYPNQQNHMYIIFPRCQVTSSMELSLAVEDNAVVSITIESKRADSGVQDISTNIWNSAPLGTISFD